MAIIEAQTIFSQMRNTIILVSNHLCITLLLTYLPVLERFMGLLPNSTRLLIFENFSDPPPPPVLIRTPVY